MIKSKVKLYTSKEGKPQAAIKFKVPKGQNEFISQVELATILLAYRDVVLKDYSDFAAIEHIREAVDIMEKEIELNKGHKEVEPEGGLEHIK